MILGQAIRGLFRKRFMVGEVTEEKNAAKQQCHEMQVPTRCGKMPVVVGLRHLNLSISEYILCTSMYISLLYISVLNKHGPVMFRYYGLQRPARCPILSMQGWGSKMLRHLRITKTIGSFWYLSPLMRKTSRTSYVTIHFLTREFLKYQLVGECLDHLRQKSFGVEAPGTSQRDARRRGGTATAAAAAAATAAEGEGHGTVMTRFTSRTGWSPYSAIGVERCWWYCVCTL